MSKKILWILTAVAFLCGLGIGTQLFSKKAQQPAQAPQQRKFFQEYTDAQLEDIIAKENFAKPNFGGKTFISFKRIGEESQNLDHIIYMWVVAQEYFKVGTEMREGSGTSLPIVMHISGSGTTKIVVPRDGAAYSTDIKKLFPEKEVDHSKIFDTKTNGMIVGELSTQNKTKAEAYFN